MKKPFTVIHNGRATVLKPQGPSLPVTPLPSLGTCIVDVSQTRAYPLTLLQTSVLPTRYHSFDTVPSPSASGCTVRLHQISARTDAVFSSPTARCPPTHDEPADDDDFLYCPLHDLKGRRTVSLGLL